VLNAITTTAMVRLGKVYGNLMVDLRPGSAKLRDRALRIVETAGTVSREEAELLYDKADGEVKTAIVMASRGLGAEASREQLQAAGGHVRKALTTSTVADKRESV
jgi:N-acetylmuramic acid 6-phosphate etherase